MLPAALRSFTRQKPCSLRLGLRCFGSDKQNYNNAIIEMLKKERDAYSAEPEIDGYRLRAFSNAIKVIERLDKPITSGMEAMKLKGVGVGIADRIGSFLDSQQPSDSVSQLERKMRRTLRNDLSQIPGIGVKKIQELMDAGCKSMADLRSRKFSSMLSHKQQVFLKYQDHLGKPTTREEAETMAKFMRDNLSSKYEIILAGDYRRGMGSFLQLEIVLLHPDHVQVPIPDPPNSPKQQGRLSRSQATRQKYLSVAKKLPNPLHGDAVPNLQNRGLICDTTANGDRKWGGIIRIPELVEGVGVDGEEKLEWGDRHDRIKSIVASEGMFRQVTIVLTPQKARPATLLAMTGDPEFVKYVRYKALSLGLYLDEFGLWRWHPQSNGEDVAPSSEGDMQQQQQTEQAESTGSGDQEGTDGYWELVQVSTEEEIFSVLGMEYVSPERRNFGYLKVNMKRT